MIKRKVDAVFTKREFPNKTIEELKNERNSKRQQKMDNWFNQE